MAARERRMCYRTSISGSRIFVSRFGAMCRNIRPKRKLRTTMSRYRGMVKSTITSRKGRSFSTYPFRVSPSRYVSFLCYLSDKNAYEQ